MSYDMTLSNGTGFGGGSGLGGWLGGIGTALPTNLANNLNMASNMYNFAAQSAIAPSAVNAQVAYNSALQQKNQLDYTDTYKQNEGLNAAINKDYWDWYRNQSPEAQARARQELMRQYGAASVPQGQSLTPAEQTNTQQATPAQQQQGLTAASPKPVQYGYTPVQDNGHMRIAWQPLVGQVFNNQ